MVYYQEWLTISLPDNEKKSQELYGLASCLSSSIKVTSTTGVAVMNDVTFPLCL